MLLWENKLVVVWFFYDHNSLFFVRNVWKERKEEKMMKIFEQSAKERQKKDYDYDYDYNSTEQNKSYPPQLTSQSQKLPQHRHYQKTIDK